MMRCTSRDLKLLLGKLGVFSGKQVCAILTRNGFVEVRQRGNHAVMQLRLDQTTVTVPVSNHTEIKIGTLQSIIRQSGLARSEFEV